jgi:dTDP-4-dehydrorhamnose 3,5-epimerase
VSRRRRNLMPEPVGAGIDGAYLFPLNVHSDGRGSFNELYRREWIPGSAAMLQANLSISHPNVLRGLHFHRKQADYWCVIQGTAFVGLYDLRSGSSTEGKKAEIRIVAEEQRHGLYIPKGVAHGFYAVTTTILQYLVDRYFTGEDEFGIGWDDPDVGLDWPAQDPHLSERDRSNPSLAEVLRSIKPAG